MDRQPVHVQGVIFEAAADHCDTVVYTAGKIMNA